MKLSRGFGALVLACLLGMTGPARAELAELKVITSYGLAFLPLMIAEKNRMVEARASAAGLGDVKVKWVTGGIGPNTNDALLTGAVDIAATGITPIIILWDKTYGRIGVKGLSALSLVTFGLTSRNPAVHTVKDFGSGDHIALPGIGVSPQAVLLEMAAAQAFGRDSYNKLDPLTVTMNNPDGTTAMLTGKTEVNAHFTTPPFLYQELATPGIHPVTDSMDVLGGPAAIDLTFTTTKFHDENPRLYKAFLSAMEDAVAFIEKDKRGAAEIYLEKMGDRRSSVDDIVALLNRPDVAFTTAPKNVSKFSDFLGEIGRISHRPTSWKEMFFPEIHDQPGS